MSLPFAAEGLLCAKKALCFKQSPKLFPAILGILLVGVNICYTYAPIVHVKNSKKKKFAQQITRQVAAWIADDWKGTHAPATAIFKCDQYQSGKHPLVQSELERVGWLCGGQNYPTFFAAENIKPDYIVSCIPAEHSCYALVKEIAPFKIYKRTGLRQ